MKAIYKYQSEIGRRHAKRMGEAMIVHRFYYLTFENALGKHLKLLHEGWYLFGVIKLYSRQLERLTNP